MDTKYDVKYEKWEHVDPYMQRNWQEILDGVPIEEIERYLRRKKLENIDEV